MIRLICGAAALTAVVGCAPIQPPEPASDHPASTQATQAEDTQLSGVLTIDEENLPQTPSEMRRSMMHHGHGKMNGRTGGANFAEKDHVARYTCAMHPEIIVETPGKCPKCAMQLVPKGRAEDE